ncbi:MAG: hypothetical protein K9N07_06555 [Candidatus Cloacimonetes bacterium]|nr:hypothetical protein [Candidatus Cloacimonadota bacterium]
MDRFIIIDKEQQILKLERSFIFIQFNNIWRENEEGSNINAHVDSINAISNFKS